MGLLQKLKDRRDATNKALGEESHESQKKLDKALKLKGKYGESFNGNIN